MLPMMDRRTLAKFGLGSLVAALPAGMRAVAALPAEVAAPVTEIVDDPDVWA